MAAQSFVSYGIVDPANGAHARVSGLVEEVRTATVGATGQTFHAVGVSVEGVGLSLAVCLPGGDWPEAPRPGDVLAGTVHLVASLDELWSPARSRRGWFRRG